MPGHATVDHVSHAKVARDAAGLDLVVLEQPLRPLGDLFE